MEHHKARKSLGASLWQQPSSEDLLALLSPDRMLNTIAHFPQQRRIIPQVSDERKLAKISTELWLNPIPPRVSTELGLGVYHSLALSYT